MQRSTAVVGTILVCLLVVVVLLWTGTWIQFLDPGPYERTTVTVVDENGSELGQVDARVAASWQQKTVGLSRTASLGSDEGMVFVHDQMRRQAYVMREMSFPLDIVFVAENGTITRIHHAAAPGGDTGEGSLKEYVGVGKYVLEVRRGWTNETGVSVGDRVGILNRTSVTRGNETAQSPSDGTATLTRTASTASATPTPSGPTVRAIDANGTDLGVVSVAIANNSSERYTGLSDTASMAWDEGMLFVFPESDQHTFVMRRMDFPLDIVYAAANGTVTRIHHAPVPEGEYEREYPGRGKYVLEVNRGWTNETGLDVGDRLDVPNVSAS